MFKITTSDSPSISRPRVPSNSTTPTPSATNPKVPNEELEFVKSHCPPDVHPIAILHPIVKIETNCA